MKLGFEESQSSYTSGSQNARTWTETWVRTWGYCPNCGAANLSSFPNNRPVADFFCPSCNEEFELKSKKGKFGPKLANGSFKAKCERLASSNNPNFFLMNYDLKTLAVVNLFIVPKHFFVREIIEERKPLAPTARRAGWIGSNILLGRIPDSGKISHRAEQRHSSKRLCSRGMAENAFSQTGVQETRGWLLDVMKCVSFSERESSRWMRSMPSTAIWAGFIPPTRTSALKYVSNFNICATENILNS